MAGRQKMCLHVDLILAVSPYVCNWFARSAISGLRLPPGALQETVRYQSEGPRPPLAYIRPLCASDACRSRSGATLKNIFVSHALNVTYKESDPWNLLISNANQGVPVIKQVSNNLCY